MPVMECTFHDSVRLARVCSHIDDLDARNKCLTDQLLKQGYRFHKLRKFFLLLKLHHRACTMNWFLNSMLY